MLCKVLQVLVVRCWFEVKGDKKLFSGEKNEIKNVLLGIDIQTKHIYNLIESGKNGTKTTLTVNSFKTNETLSKSLFTFDASKYEDYYINKLD